MTGVNSKISELYGQYVGDLTPPLATKLLATQECPYLGRKCLKTRKSEPEISIGTCSLEYGDEAVIICPYRLLERRQVFTDCIHLLTSHEPGNELHVISELGVPGGNIDYCLVSARRGKAMDFVGIELQTLDTTGTAWPARQRLLAQMGFSVKEGDLQSKKTFSMNWKMTAKTILVQLHHKVATFEHLNKHLVLVIQDCFLSYMKRRFRFGHLGGAKLGDPMHMHSYNMNHGAEGFSLELTERLSTDTQGIQTCLGLQVSANMELQQITELIEARLSKATLLTL